ncbi:protein TolR [Castellaniella daejeonensis]|jgi:biopolymer transport protein TolR|uniref:Protein TolR n=1 Tax=Castellaniella daejeonensis TaxID=659013 RepID=A0ABP3D836_9BURK|nr:ExbD/TolR family protein [Castellaniella sp.]HET8702844.1 ExbD/TolR family protein [Castellaniella sp.]
MTSFGSRRSRRLKNDINVVPYIDVMLVLLVIFMVTAPMITPGQIELPSVGAASDVPVTPIEIQIDAEGALSMRVREGGASFRSIDKANLLAEVRSAATPDTPVVISADGKVPYESVMQVMDQLRNGGIGKLGLLVNQNAPATR